MSYQNIIQRIEDLGDSVNDNTSDISTLSSRITTNSNNISTNTSNISTLSSKVSTLSSDLTEVKDLINDLPNKIYNTNSYDSNIDLSKANIVLSSCTAYHTKTVDSDTVPDHEGHVMLNITGSGYLLHVMSTDNYSSYESVVTVYVDGVKKAYVQADNGYNTGIIFDDFINTPYRSEQLSNTMYSYTELIRRYTQLKYNNPYFYNITFTKDSNIFNPSSSLQYTANSNNFVRFPGKYLRFESSLKIYFYCMYGNIVYIKD